MTPEIDKELKALGAQERKLSDGVFLVHVPADKLAQAQALIGEGQRQRKEAGLPEFKFHVLPSKTTLTVGQLKALLADVPNDCDVSLEGCDCWGSCDGVRIEHCSDGSIAVLTRHD